MDSYAQQFATRSALIRQAIAAHQSWIEEKLGVPLSEAVIIDELPNLCEVGVPKFLGLAERWKPDNRPSRRLRPLVAKAEVPPHYPPLLNITRDTHDDLSFESLLEDREAVWTGFSWQECPLALRLHVYNCTVVVLNVPHHASPTSRGESIAQLLVGRRDSVPTLRKLLEDIFCPDGQLRIFTIGGSARRVSRLDWADLVIDANVGVLLKDDFESFWHRKDWFEERNLPFRRGYLLHGPPGNGKSSAVRALMSSRDLNAYTLRFFDRNIDDSDLDTLFDKAYRHRPSIVLFEDIDRAFPKTGESRSKISLQHLLNTLDGVGTGEGIVVVATANEPAVLDPAILRRPGRFDRVVHFANPGEDLRLEYFRRMNSGLTDDQLRRSVEGASGFSFAQLREAYITAGQLAFQRGGEVTEDDLLTGIHSLRQGMVSSARHRGSAGFGTDDQAAS